MHPKNKQFKTTTLEISQFDFDISGNDVNEKHSKNILFIFLTFEIFHLDMSGKDFNE